MLIICARHVLDTHMPYAHTMHTPAASVHLLSEAAQRSGDLALAFGRGMQEDGGQPSRAQK